MEIVTKNTIRRYTDGKFIETDDIIAEELVKKQSTLNQ